MVQPAILRYADGVWAAVSTETPMVVDLLGVWGSGHHDVYAVGGSGTVLRYEGVSWTASQLSGAPLLSSVTASKVFA